MVYSIKGLKEFNGMEDRGYNLTLYYDGRKVATAVYGGDGGMVMLDFIDKKDEQIFEDFLKTLPPVKSEYFPEGLEMTYDIYLDDLIQAHLETAQLKRWCKTKIIALKAGAEEGVYVTYGCSYTPEAAARIRVKHPEIIEIVNERFL